MHLAEPRDSGGYVRRRRGRQSRPSFTRRDPSPSIRTGGGGQLLCSGPSEGNVAGVCGSHTAKPPNHYFCSRGHVVASSASCNLLERISVERLLPRLPRASYIETLGAYMILLRYGKTLRAIPLLEGSGGGSCGTRYANTNPRGSVRVRPNTASQVARLSLVPATNLCTTIADEASALHNPDRWHCPPNPTPEPPTWATA